MEEEKSEIKLSIIKIVISAILLVASILIEKNTNLETWQYLLIYLVPYLVIGGEVLKEAFEKLFHGEFFEEDFLMSVATIGALCIGFLPNTETMFSEAVFVMLFFKVGELFEEIAEGKSEKSITKLAKIRPHYANKEFEDEVKQVAPKEVQVGDIIEVYPGEKVPLDGVIIQGASSVNTAAITGESVPVGFKEGDIISSGFICLSSNLKIKVTKSYDDSTVSKIIDLVKNAIENKSKSEKFITKFSRVYTPTVVLIAVLLAIVPPILLGDFMANFSTWLVRALTFLVVSCPCALVISVPLSFFGGIGSLSKHGILVKGSGYLEDLTKAKNIVFDKTGTLTKGSFEVVAIHPEEINEEELLHLAAHVERFSKHPIAISLKQAYKNEDDGCQVEVIEDVSGEGISARVNGAIYFVGNEKLMNKNNIEFKNCHKEGTIVHVANEKEYLGHIVISDVLKEDSKEAIHWFNKNNKVAYMLTGDNEAIAKSVCEELGIKKYFANLSPIDKEEKVKEIIRNEAKSEKTIFVGDGINDAPVIAGADVGIAMGALGQDAAIEVADVVLMKDSVSDICKAIEISQKTMKIAYQNIVFAILVKVLVLILSAFGYAPMWLAVFADVGVTVLCVLNAIRTLKI